MTQATQDVHYRTAEASQYLKISSALLRKLERLGLGPKRAKLGRAVIYRREDLDAFVSARVRSGS